jgi:hypothetical protein
MFSDECLQKSTVGNSLVDTDDVVVVCVRGCFNFKANRYGSMKKPSVKGKADDHE